MEMPEDVFGAEEIAELLLVAVSIRLFESFGVLLVERSPEIASRPRWPLQPEPLRHRATEPTGGLPYSWPV
ncbi:MAG: hypothetical protein ACYCSF_07600 [Acidimicrobiales bacterium]